MATQQTTVVRYPTKRVRPYPNPRLSVLPEGVIPIRTAYGPAPLNKTPELAVLVAILAALSSEQREAVKSALYRKAYEDPGDEALYRAQYHVGRLI